MPIRCLVVDDHTLFRAGLRRLLEGEEDLAVVGEAGDAEAALEKARALQPDLVLMDIGMPGMSSLEAARLMKAEIPGPRVIFLTMHEDQEYLARCLQTGADGFMLKDVPAPRLIHTIRQVCRGEEHPISDLLTRAEDPPRRHGRAAHATNLTQRERQVMKLIAEGLSVREAAGRLGVSVKTVEAHKFNLMRKLDLHNRAQLVTYAIQKKIVKMSAEI